MKQGSEAFQESYLSGENNPKKKEAVILPFKQKAEEPLHDEYAKKYEYKEYRKLGGALSQEEYENVLKRSADGKYAPSSSLWQGHANFMAEATGITLTPEAVVIYGILRSENPDPIKEHFSEMSDQKLLAEALRIVGDKISLDIFIEKLPHIFN